MLHQFILLASDGISLPALADFAYNRPAVKRARPSPVSRFETGAKIAREHIENLSKSPKES